MSQKERRLLNGLLYVESEKAKLVEMECVVVARGWGIWGDISQRVGVKVHWFGNKSYQVELV